MQTHYDYINYNPVKHGYVDIVDQWAWSSISGELSDEDIASIPKKLKILNKKGYSFGE